MFFFFENTLKYGFPFFYFVVWVGYWLKCVGLRSDIWSAKLYCRVQVGVQMNFNWNFCTLLGKPNFSEFQCLYLR